MDPFFFTGRSENEWRSKDNMLSWMVEAHVMPSRWWQEALLGNVTMSSILMTRKEHIIVGRLSGSAVLMFVKNEMLEARSWELLVKVQPLKSKKLASNSVQKSFFVLNFKSEMKILLTLCPFVPLPKSTYGQRLQYVKMDGSGPQEGWISFYVAGRKAVARTGGIEWRFVETEVSCNGSTLREPWPNAAGWRFHVPWVKMKTETKSHGRMVTATLFQWDFHIFVCLIVQRCLYFGVAISVVKVEADHGVRQEQLPDDLWDQENRQMASAVFMWMAWWCPMRTLASNWTGGVRCLLFSPRITRHFMNQMY